MLNQPMAFSSKNPPSPKVDGVEIQEKYSPTPLPRGRQKASRAAFFGVLALLAIFRIIAEVKWMKHEENQKRFRGRVEIDENGVVR